MDDRTRRLGRHTAQTAPAWAITALGPVPADPAARHDWARQAALIAAYREMYGYEHPGDPIGPEPSHEAPDQRAAWHQAYLAPGPAAGPDVRAMPDGRLWLLRDTYATQTAWAPHHVGKQLRLSRLGAFDAALLGIIRADAEAQAARKTGDRDHAATHEHLAASYRAMRDHYQRQAQAHVQTMADRQEWEQTIAASRRRAIAADAELRRRHPDQKMEPLRSAEPAFSGTEREQAHPAADHEVSQVQQEWFRVTLQARQALKVTIEDPGWSGLDTLFSAGRTPGRAAILQPPKPSIEPSARILQRVAEHDIEPEASG